VQVSWSFGGGDGSLNASTDFESWTARLATAIAAALREIAPRLSTESVALFAVDCHPWQCCVGPAILTGDELAENRTLAEPSHMAEWRYYDFASELEAGRLFIPLGEEMRSAYYQSEDKPATAVRFLEACAVAATSPQVAEALALLKRRRGFRVSVTHPDSDQEFVVRG